MAYLGTETIGGKPAWRVGDNEENAILTDDPLYAMQHGAPVFDAPPEAQAMAPAPSPMPDMRTADNAALIQQSLGVGGAPQIENRAPMLGVADPNAVTPESIDAQQERFSKQAEQALSPPETVESPRIEGETVSLQPGMPGGQQMADGSPGSQFRQSYAEQVASNMLPPGARYSSGRASSPAMWLPGQRSTQMQGNPELNAKTLSLMEKSMERQAMADELAMEAQRVNLIERDVTAQKAMNEAEWERKRLEKVAEKQQKEMERRWSQVESALMEASDTKVDPKRFTNNQSFGEQVIVGALMTLAGGAAAAAGQENAVSKELDKQIARDIAQQESVLRSRGEKAKALNTSFARWMKENDPDMARDMARAQMMEYQGAVLRKAAAQESMRGMSAALMSAAAERDARKAELLQSMNDRMQVQTTERFIPEVKGFRGGIVQRPLTAKEAKEALDTGKAIGEELDASGAGSVDDGKSVRDPTTGDVIKRHEDAKTINKDLYLYQSGRNDIDTLRSMAENYSSMNPEERSKAEAQAAVVAQRIWSGAMGRTDAPSANEMEPIQAIAANPAEFFRNSQLVNARLETIRNSMDNTESVYRNSFGIPQGNYGAQPYTQAR